IALQDIVSTRSDAEDPATRRGQVGRLRAENTPKGDEQQEVRQRGQHADVREAHQMLNSSAGKPLAPADPPAPVTPRKGSGGDELVRRVDDRGFQVEVLVLVVDAAVVHLDRDRADPTGLGILEVEYLERLALGRGGRGRG